MKKITFFLMVALLSGACGGLKDNQLIEESETLRQEINGLLPEVKQNLENLEFHANSINIQGRALTTEEIESTAAISGVSQSFLDWKKQYEQAQKILKNEQINPLNLLNGYKRASKELQTIQKRVEELSRKISS